MPSTLRLWLRSTLGLLAGALAFFVVYLVAWFTWFAVTGANFKIGPEDLPVPEWIFYTISLAGASAATALVALPVVSGHLTGFVRVFAAVFALSGVWFLATALITGDPESRPIVFYGAMVLGAVTGVVTSRLSRVSSPEDLPTR